MMAGVVPPSTRRALQQRVRASGGDYPWEAVIDAVLADPVDDRRLLQKGLQAQRDWVSQPGSEPIARRVRRRGRSALAWLLSRVIFFAIYSVAAIALLVLLELRWPELDISALGDWLRRTFPGVFGRF